MPTQGGLERETFLFQKGRDLIRGLRLFRGASAKKSEQCPAQERNGDGREEMSDFCEKKSGNNEDKYAEKKSRKKKDRRDVRYDRRVQAQCDATSKSYGNRNGRKPHGALRKLTKVSM